VGIKAILPITVNTLAHPCVIIKTNNMDQELVRHFVEECKRDQEWDERWRSNYIEFDNYFKYSGKTEPYKVLISHYRYNNKACNYLHEQYINKKDYDKLWEENKNHPGRFSKEIETYYWDETKDSVWSD